MRTLNLNWWALGLGAVVMAAGARTLPAQVVERRGIVVSANDEQNVPGAKIEVLQDIVAKMSDYWLGIDCQPADDALRSQLALPEGQGLVVRRVVPESPAATAGLKQHDVLLAAGDSPLKDMRDLMKMLDDNKDKKLTLKLIRGGKPTTVEVTPARRPEEFDVRVPGPVKAGDLLGEFDRELQFRFVHPGILLPRGAQATFETFPDNLSVQINKQGNEPAKIKVKHGDESWEVTEKDLSKLPDKVRPFVEGMLGKVGPPRELRNLRLWLDEERETAEEAVKDAKPSAPSGERPRLERRLEDLDRQLHELRKELKDLREKRSERIEESRLRRTGL